jgi:hypothetical protein
MKIVYPNGGIGIHTPYQYSDFKTKEAFDLRRNVYQQNEETGEYELVGKDDCSIEWELDDIKYLKFENYFLTLYYVFDRAQKRTLIGPGRGSGAGSLVNFVLGITSVDPIKYDLLWERFLGRHKACLDPDTLVLARDGIKKIKDVSIGDEVLTSSGQFNRVANQVVSRHTSRIRIFSCGQEFVCSPNHRWIVQRNGERIEIRADEILKTDKLFMIKSHTSG